MRPIDGTISNDLLIPFTTAEMARRWCHVPLMTWVGCLALFAVAFSNLVDIEADNDTVALSGQALIKLLFLAVAGVYGGSGLLTDARVRRTLLSFPMVWVTAIWALYCVSVVTSPTPLPSLASTLSIACVVLMTVTALVQLGVRTVLWTLYCAMSIYVVLSWAAFLVLPDIGIFLEATSDAETVARMGGLAHPNTLGQVSGLTLVLGLALYEISAARSPWHKLVLVLAAGALIGSLSRTSLLATGLALLIVYRNAWLNRKWVMAASLATFIGCISLIVLALSADIESVLWYRLGMLSKSGDVGELTSATGRTEIWAYALQLIAERPLTGYGAATSKIYLSDYSFHCHNLVINVAFSTGVLGGLLALWMCLEQVFKLCFRVHPVADGLVAFILINGLFENVIFSILAGLPTMIWIAGLVVPQLEQDEASRIASYSPSASGASRSILSSETADGGKT